MKRIVLGVIALNLSACITLPDVYLIDRHSVMEAEASGEWPELEKRFQTQGVSAGPVNYAKETSGIRRQRAFRVLNGEFPAKEGPKNAEPEKAEHVKENTEPKP